MLGQRWDPTHGAATTHDILTHGQSVDVTVIEASSMGRTNGAGVGMYAVALLIERATAPRQTVVSSPVPSDCLGLLDGGTNLPARILEADPNAIAIDWDFARREHVNSLNGDL